MDHSKKPEKENPKKKSNPLSQLFFTWTIPLLCKGAKKGLNQDDLTKCMEKDRSEELGDRLEDEWYKEIDRAQKKGREPKLKNALFRTFWRESFFDGILYAIFITIKSFVPFILAQLLKVFQLQQSPINSEEAASQSTIDVDAFNRSARSINGDSVEVKDSECYIWNDVNWLASIVIVLTTIACFIWHHVGLREDLLGARMRIACCSLMYRKTLRLSKKTAGNTPAGYLVNLLSNDVNRLDYGFIYIHYIWILPFQSVLIAYLIWQQIGMASLIGVIGLLLKTVPVHTGLSKLSSKFRSKIAYRTDKRVGIMNELVQGIQVIKMYAWEKPFQAVVAEARRQEIKQIRYASFVRGIYLSSMVFTERSTLYITIAGCVLLEVTKVTAELVFSLAQYFNILQLVSAVFYPLAVSFAAEAFVSIGRIQEYLMKENQDEKSFGITQKNESNNQCSVIIDKVSASWDGHDVDPQNEKLTLANLNLKVKKGTLCAIVGPVGAGKSSLLHMLLGEVPILQGNVTIYGDISYGSQEPWLFTGTVRNNILFGEPYDRKRYSEVTRCCALLTDFEQLPDGDKTVVGDRGASLSGGQRARISLARAMYKKASVYLLDDPLSAVDAHVGRHLFDEVLGPKSGLANENVTRFLVTHQVHFLTEADWIVIVEDGKISHQGSYSDLANSDVDFAKLMDRKAEDVKHSESEDEGSDIGVMSYEDDEDIPYIDGVKGYSPLKKRRTSSMSSNDKSSVGDLSVREEDKENLADGQVSPRIWKKYFTAGGSGLKLFMLFTVLILSQVVCSGSDYFSNYWTQQEYLRGLDEPTELTTYQCLYIYGILILCVVFMTVLRGYMFFSICMRASKVLHNRMFKSILNATMRFFDTNPSGRILNRFSKDMGAIDEYLPMVLMTFLQVFLVMSGILILVIVVNPILVIALLAAIFFYVILLRSYLRPSQDLKRLEGVCRSPVFSHLSATLSGLSTIRARGLQDLVIKEFDNLQDVHSGAWHLTKSLNYAFGLWLDIVSCAFLTAVTFSFLVGDSKTFSGSVGLAISQAMILTGMVQHGVRQATESLQSMTSVERVIEYTDLDQESKIEKKPQPSWPSKGNVVFKDMSLRYAEDSAPVLKNLNIRIEAGWKVGIVGRTGAGKSSLIGALFRLSPIEGEIFIDDVETGSIALENLRSRISIIPQDPVLFSASVRYNLDPFEKYSDQEIWAALGEVELKSSIQGLDFMVTERGSNFSVGQRQLICLARAILRNNKVLVLDEATANVDPQTDALIQKTIRRKFKECTVLTVAHRLHTVMDSDRILVMDAGFAKEFDAPHLLLQNSRGLLRQMVDATGAYDSEQLKRVAKETYDDNN